MDEFRGMKQQVGDESSQNRQSELTKDNRHQATVWLVNHYANSLELPGITRHAELAQQLANDGWRVRIMASAFHHNTATYRRPVRWWRPALTDTEDGIEFTWLFSTKYRDNGWKRYLNMIAFTGVLVATGARQERPDVIVGSSPHLLTGLGGWVLARRYRVPFVFEVRDMWPDMLVQLGLTSPVIIKPLEALEGFLYKNADRIIALTDGVRDRIAAKGVSPDKITVIPNASLKPPPLNTSARGNKRREMGWEGHVVVVWAGSHNPMNGLDVVIDAAWQLHDRKDVRFVFIGDGSLKTSLQERAKGLNTVEFYDPLPKTQISECLQAADIGLLHSRKFEVFTGARPNKLFDYMAAGLAIVSTVPGEAWRLIDEAQAGVAAEWENPGSLAQAILQLADDPAARSAMGQRAFHAVSTVHSREATAADLSMLLSRVISAPYAGSVKEEPGHHVQSDAPFASGTKRHSSTQVGISHGQAAD